MKASEKVKDARKAIESKANRIIIRRCLFFLLGLLMSTGSVFGSLHPFGVSITAVSKKRSFIYTAAGAAAGCLLTGINERSARYLCAVVLAALGAFASAAFDLGTSPYFAMANAFTSVAVTGAVLNLKTSAAAGEYVLVLAEALLSLGAAFFFYKALRSDYRRLRLRALPASDLSCIIISLSLLLMNLSPLSFLVFSPSVILAAFFILFALRFLGEKRAAVFATVFGFAVSISAKEALFTAGAFPFSALVCSLFSAVNPLAAGFAFLISATFFGVAADNAFSLTFVSSCAVGALLFALIPPRLTEKLEKLNADSRGISPEAALRQSIVLRLRFASNAMAAISESVEQVREKISAVTRAENEKRRGEIGEERYIREEIILEKTNQIRKVASDQFYSISGMLEDLAFEFDEAELFDSAASAKIRRIFGEHDIYPLNISVIEDKFGRMRVEILTDSQTAGLNNPKLVKEIGRACNRYFDKGRITNFKNETMLSFSEKPNYALSVGFAQHSAEGRLCGDTVKIMTDGKGHSILIISDGMGKGSRAALDGAMGAGLLSKLLGAGFGFDSSLKIVNSALLIKSNDESLATLDIASVDLFTGKCEIFKAGAPASFILRGDNLTRCELTSMPAGILRGIEFARRTAVLKPDDLLILMSDGISELGEEWLNSLLLSVRDYSPQEAADYIIKEALSVADERTADDMSVIIAKAQRNI